ncbi:aminotransferase class I/II-fold pyridoxal phosphate-dependent enzyme [Citricoccus sp. GCM10030269]|uniref:aminotransferase class I/II-fold pyridoxal phosphate-dependent enzyme n=1 Tax=Citricoccus sp. GCM10030269 TaxID=3273388 RepID=UPI0036163CDC
MPAARRVHPDVTPVLPADRPAVHATTIFETMTQLAQHHGAVNLGQGFPDDDGPEWVRRLAAEAILSGRNRANQYAPGAGLPALRRAVAEHQQRHYGIGLDPDRQVVITTGATEGIAAALLALTGPGDEVVSFEPFYDSYAAVTAVSGAAFITVPLSAPDFQPSATALEEAITERTRVLLLNSPHNPTGTVVPPEVLSRIVEVCARHDVLILSDEVYEHLVYDGVDGRHHSVAAVPGASARTLTVSSAGKSFSMTGWKVGWVTGPAELVTAVRAVKQFLTYSSGPAYQGAIAEALGEGDAFLAEQRDRYRALRDRLVSGLRRAGLDPVVPAAGYFTVTDLGVLGVPDAAAAAEELAERAGVVGIPVSALCRPTGESDGAVPFRSWMRWAFCKQPAVVDEAVVRLQGLRDLGDVVGRQ